MSLHPAAEKSKDSRTGPSGAQDTSQNVNLRWRWEEHFGQMVDTDHPIWKKYVEVAVAHDKDVFDAMNHSMDILLVFSGLFSAVVTTFIVQTEQPLQLPSAQVAQRDLPNADTYDQRLSHLETTVILWYISLDCALFVAGGAVCVKQWLLDYRRSNKVHRIPYNRAIYHQERYASLRRWFIPQFADLLGCILLLDLLPFFTGMLFHVTSNNILLTLACFFMGLYSAFLGFTIIVGILVPTCPYNTPISSLIGRTPWKLRPSATRTLYTALMALVLAVVLSVIFVEWCMTAVTQDRSSGDSDVNVWPLLLWVIPMICMLMFGLRNGLRIGRISFFVPAICTAITILTVLLLISTFVYNNNIGPILSFGNLMAFTLVIAILAYRFSSVKSSRNFPVVALLFSASGLSFSLFLCTSPRFKWSLPLSTAMIWISMTVLGIASTSREAEVEEDTRKVEAVGWLISQASDEETLHCALACIPSVANTPLRRQILMELTRQTLALLLHTIVAAPEQQCMIGTSRARIIRAPRDDGGLDRESRLMFYVTCLAEISQAPVLKQEPGWILFGFQRNRWVSCVVQSWLYNNWHRFLTIPPAQETFTRGLRFYHHWYSWLRPITPDQLQVDLGTLSKHPNIHLRAAAKVALCQLFPSSLSILDISSWPSPPLGSFGLADARAYCTLLGEVRMVTFRAIDAYQYSRTLNTSVLRYLQWYCDAILRLWTSNIEYQKGSIFEVLMVLGYVIIENHSDVVDVTRFGCATPMKAARCIMALKRLHDCSTECDTMLEMDRHLHSSLAFSMVAAVAKYLQIAVTLMERGHPPILSEEGIEVDEDSITTGMKYLEYALLQLAEQDWPEEVPPQIILALEAIYLINKHYQVKLLSLDAHYNPAPLIERLKYRAASCDTVSERISAVWTASRILNKMPDPSSAWLLAIKHPWSLLATIQSMAQEGSPDSHLAALSTLLDTPIFRPEAINVGKMHVSNFGSSGPHFASSNLPDATVLNILPTQTVKLKRLYVDIFNDTSQLTQVISNLSSSQGADIISKSLTLLSALIHHLHPNYSPSSFFEAEKYPKILTSIASHNDLELIPTPIRKLAIELFFRVWQYRFQNIAKADGHQNTRVKEAFGCNLYISEIGESINLLADRHTTIALDSILLFTEQLEATYNFIPAHTRAAWRNLVDSLKNAVIWADFGRAGEDERERAFTRLAMLQKCLSISRNH